eukprot:COSAG02_NODE_47932_length_337_cov_1.302521_1_plen_83_part_01
MISRPSRCILRFCAGTLVSNATGVDSLACDDPVDGCLGELAGGLARRALCASTFNRLRRCSSDSSACVGLYPNPASGAGRTNL